MARAASTTSSSTQAAGAPAAVTPKGQATRASILQTAAAVFAERGYTDTTLAELIARSGLTKGAFYFHFASKEQLALAVLEEKQRQWLEFVRQRALDKPRAIDQLLALGPALIRLHRQDPGAYSAQRLSRDLARIPELAGTIRAQMRGWIDLVADIISRAQRDGDLPAQLDATALAAILVAATDGLKDLSDILDPPSRSRRGFEQRMQHLTDILEALISQHEDSSHS
jgi:TetR/AcrR family transcriptional repressor of nem operon